MGRERDQNEQQKSIADPYAVKLSNMPNATTEEEIMDAMKKFGLVKKCRIPTNRETLRPLGFAIVVFDQPEQAQRAIEEGEITVDLACLDIERAMQSRRPPFGERSDRREGGGFGDRPAYGERREGGGFGGERREGGGGFERREGGGGFERREGGGGFE